MYSLTKLYYRNSLLSCIVAGDDPVGIALKKITLRDAIIHLAAAGDKLSPDGISKCWHNIMVKVLQKLIKDNWMKTTYHSLFYNKD